MRIKHARAVHQDTSPRGFATLARFALQPTEGVLIYDCTLVRAPDGRTLIYGPPSKNGAPILSLAPDVRNEVIMMTLHEVGIDDHANAA